MWRGTAEWSGGSKTTIYSALARIELLFFPVKPDLGQRYLRQIEPSFWKEIAENTLASWHKERRWERPKKERTFTIRKSLSQKEANKREEMKWKARFGVRTEGRAKQKIDRAPTKNENICMVTKIEGIMPGSARIWTEMKQTKMQEKLFCSLLPSK